DQHPPEALGARFGELTAARVRALLPEDRVDVVAREELADSESWFAGRWLHGDHLREAVHLEYFARHDLVDVLLAAQDEPDEQREPIVAVLLGLAALQVVFIEPMPRDLQERRRARVGYMDEKLAELIELLARLREHLALLPRGEVRSAFVSEDFQ